MDTIITRDGAELFYKDWGDGQPVVFSHAWPLNADMWEAQMRFLAARGYRCIAYDRRGFGRSSKPWDGYGHDTFADDLASLVHALDLIDAVLVGCSMGGGDVVRYLTRHGGRRVDRIVLLGTFLPAPLRTAENPAGLDGTVFEAMQRAIVADRPEFLRTLHRRFFAVSAGSHPVSKGMRRWLFGMAMQAGVSALADSVTVFSGSDFRLELGRIDVPTLVLHGDADAFAPIAATGRRAAALIPAARLVVIAGGPHGLWHTHQDEVNAALLAFLKERGAAAEP